jgi:competence protein ComEA
MWFLASLVMDARDGPSQRTGRHALPRHATSPRGFSSGRDIEDEFGDQDDRPRSDALSWESWQDKWWRVWSPGAARAVALALVVLLAIAAWWWWQGRPRPMDPAPPPGAGEVINPGVVVDPGTGAPADGPDSREAQTVTVHVAGRVRRPGLVTLPAGARVADAITAAGGLRGDAGPIVLNLAALLVDGERLEVRRGSRSSSGAQTFSGGQGNRTPPDGAGSGAPGGLVNVNTATASELESLPGIGPVLAGRIIAWREANGAFTAVEILGEVAGIGPVLLENLRPLVTV